MLGVMAEPPLLLALDLTGTFAFALNGAITGLEKAKLDIIGMLTLGMITALGGGILRDILINALPPATFSSWPYLAVAAGGALIAFFLSRQLRRFALTILLLDAAGLSLFCVTGATKSLEYGLGPAQAVILGAVTAVGGGTIRDVLVRQVPTVLTSGLYAIPALVGAAIAVTAWRTGVYGVPAALGAALACFLIRLAGIRYNIDAPIAREDKSNEDKSNEDKSNGVSTPGIPVRAAPKSRLSGRRARAGRDRPRGKPLPRPGRARSGRIARQASGPLVGPHRRNHGPAALRPVAWPSR